MIKLIGVAAKLIGATFLLFVLFILYVIVFNDGVFWTSSYTIECPTLEAPKRLTELEEKARYGVSQEESAEMLRLRCQYWAEYDQVCRVDFGIEYKNEDCRKALAAE